MHNYETAVHESFLNSLYYCSQQAQALSGPNFTQCIKAAGINFNTAYSQFFEYKSLRQQALNQGIAEW